MPTDFFGRVMVVFNRYGMSMLQGAGVSLKIALVGTLVGCIIGFAVGIVQTIPSERGDNPVKRAVLWVVKLILNAYVEFSADAHDGPGHVYLLRASAHVGDQYVHVGRRLFHSFHQYRRLHG